MQFLRYDIIITMLSYAYADKFQILPPFQIRYMLRLQSLSSYVYARLYRNFQTKIKLRDILIW